MEKRTSLFENGLIWFGAGVSIAEIVTGTYLAPLGFGKGLAAILLGHVIGCVLLYLAGHMGGVLRRSAMETAKLSFGQKGALLFAVLNILQLVGWTGIMIYDGALAADTIWGVGRWVWCLVIGALIVLCVVVGVQSCENKKEHKAQTTESADSSTESDTASEGTTEKATESTEAMESTEAASSVVESLSYTTAYEFGAYKILEIGENRVITVEYYDSDEEFDSTNFNLREFDFSSYYATGLVDYDYKVFSFYIIYNVVDGVYYLGSFDDLEVGDMFCYMEDSSGHCYMLLYKQ